MNFEKDILNVMSNEEWMTDQAITLGLILNNNYIVEPKNRNIIKKILEKFSKIGKVEILPVENNFLYRIKNEFCKQK